jgi:hypothetical protein
VACLFLRLAFGWWQVVHLCRDAAEAVANGRVVPERVLDFYRGAVADAEEVRPSAVARLKQDIRALETRLAAGSGSASGQR